MSNTNDNESAKQFSQQKPPSSFPSFGRVHTIPEGYNFTREDTHAVADGSDIEGEEHSEDERQVVVSDQGRYAEPQTPPERRITPDHYPKPQSASQPLSQSHPQSSLRNVSTPIQPDSISSPSPTFQQAAQQSAKQPIPHFANQPQGALDVHSTRQLADIMSQFPSKPGNKYGNVTIKGNGRVLAGNVFDNPFQMPLARQHTFGSFEVGDMGQLLPADVSVHTMRTFFGDSREMDHQAAWIQQQRFYAAQMQAHAQMQSQGMGMGNGTGMGVGDGLGNGQGRQAGLGPQMPMGGQSRLQQ